MSIWYIRQETPADYDEVYNLVKCSFESSPGCDGTVPDYLNEVRKKDTFIPELSLVAENEQGQIIGQVVLYKTDIKTNSGIETELLLSPISVHPDYFRMGIARSMIEKAFDIARAMGYRAVFLCGHPPLYHRLGFVPTYQYNIYHINDRTAEWSMVRELYPNALAGISGTVNTI